MRRARRWIAIVGPLLLAGCSSTSNPGGDSSTGGDVLWTIVYLAAIVLAIVGAKLLVESHQ